MKTLVALLLSILFSHTVLAQSALPPRAVMVLAVEGKLEASADGKKFKRARQGETYKEGTIFRVKGSSHADLFFRRIGTMVRMMPKTELEVEKLQWHRNPAGIIVKETILDLRKGRVFAFVRVLFPESKFQIRTASEIATLQGSGTGRYDIGADGRFVAGKSSRSSLKVIVEGNERVIDPGQVFNARGNRVSPLSPSEQEMIVIELDELQRLAELLTPEPQPDEKPTT